MKCVWKGERQESVKGGRGRLILLIDKKLRERIRARSGGEGKTMSHWICDIAEKELKENAGK